MSEELGEVEKQIAWLVDETFQKYSDNTSIND